MVKRSTTKALKAVRKAADIYEATRDRPKTIHELTAFTVTAVTNIYRLIREMNSQIDALEVNYKHTNERQVAHEESSRHLPKIPNLYAHED